MLRLLTILLFCVSFAQAQVIERSVLLNREEVPANAPGQPPEVVIVKDTARFFFTETQDSCIGWKNIFGSCITGFSVRTGTSNGISLTTVALTNWAGISGKNANDTLGTTSGVFFNDCFGTNQAVMRGYYLSINVYDHTKPQFRITGLKPGKTYRFRATGSNSSINRTTGIRIEGLALSAEQSYNPQANTTAGVTFSGVSSFADGHLDVFMYRIGSNGSAISAMEIIEE